MTGDPNPWYIDAFDPIAGFCFASNRSADLNGDPDLDLPGLYLAPPLFQPEAVASRGIAFAAARGSFQLGLFLDEAEVAFQTLDSLIEFVRRCYLSGGRTDGSGGRDPWPVPRRPDVDMGERRFPDFRDFGESSAQASVMDAVTHFGSMVREAGNGPVAVSYQNVPPRSSHPRAERFNDDVVMSYVAAQLIVELLDRIPSTRTGAPWTAWVDAASRLGQAIRRLHLGYAMIAQFSVQLEIALLLAETTYLGGTPPPVHGAAQTHRELLFRFFGLVFDDHRQLQPLWPHLYGEGPAFTDPIDDLSCWPLPPELARPNVVSVLDHLSAVTASPDQFGKPLSLATAMALFAAAHILRRPSAAWPFEPSDEVTRLVRQVHFGRSALWLFTQFPRFAYPPRLEDLIASVGTETNEEPTYGRSIS